MVKEGRGIGTNPKSPNPPSTKIYWKSWGIQGQTVNSPIPQNAMQAPRDPDARTRNQSSEERKRSRAPLEISSQNVIYPQTARRFDQDVKGCGGSGFLPKGKNRRGNERKEELKSTMGSGSGFGDKLSGFVQFFRDWEHRLLTARSFRRLSLFR